MQNAMTIRLTNRALVLVLGLLGFVWVLRNATHIAIVLFIAVLLAAAISSAANRLEARGVKRGVTILAIYALILAILAGVVALIVPVVTAEVGLLRRNLPAYEEQANALLARLPHEGEALRVNVVVRDFAGRLGQASAQAGRVVATAGTTLLTLLVVLVMTYLLASDTVIAERLVGRFVPPAHRPRALRIMARIGDQLGNWMQAQLVLAVIFGLAFGAGLWALGVPFALTLGTVGVVLELIPYVGGLFAAFLAMLVAATTGELWRVAAVFALYMVVANVEAHLISPRVMGDFVGLPPLAVIVAVFIGAETIGGLGALLAVPVAVIIQTFLDEFWTFPQETAAGDISNETPAVRHERAEATDTGLG